MSEMSDSQAVDDDLSATPADEPTSHPNTDSEPTATAGPTITELNPNAEDEPNVPDSPPNGDGVMESDDGQVVLHSRSVVGNVGEQGDEFATEDEPPPSAIPPTPPAKPSTFPEHSSPGHRSTPDPHSPRPERNPGMNGHRPTATPPTPESSHRRSLTISRGHTVSVVLISTALETISASKEAKRSAPLRDSVKLALEMVRSGQGGDKPRDIFEPLRLACETRNEKLMIASLDCISKLISYSFFAEPARTPSHSLLSPPPSPGPAGWKPVGGGSEINLPEPSLVDLVTHTITACYTETIPDTVSLQIVKALLSLVLSSTILVHHSSLLKAVRTVYNVFLLSTDPVNQMVAQGGLTQMVHHVFSRCKSGSGSKDHPEESTPLSSAALGNTASPNRTSFHLPRPEAVPIVTNEKVDTEEFVSNASGTQSAESLPAPVAVVGNSEVNDKDRGAKITR